MARRPSTSWLTGVIRRPGFWLLAAVLVLITISHYAESIKHPAFLVDLRANLGLERYAFERILYLAPIIWAGFLFGARQAVITSFVALACMLPRAIFISRYPNDALFETSAVFIVGNLMAFFFESLRKERERRLQLAALHQTSGVVSQSLELGQVLSGSIDSVMDVMKLDAALVFLMDEQVGELALTAHRGVSEQFIGGVGRLKLGEGFNGQVAETGEPLFVEDASHDPSLTKTAVTEEGIRSQLIVPLKSKGKVVGTLCVAMRSQRRFRQEEIDLLTAIGNQIGVAIENARLYEWQRDSENRYRTIFETTGAASVIIEEDTTISLANMEFEKLSGYSREEVEGKKSWTEFVVEDHLERMKEYHRLRRIDTKAAPDNYEFRFVDRWGNVKDIFLNIATIPGTKKSVASLSDVTKLKRVEEQIRASEERYRELFESANDAIWLHDLQGNIIAANRSFVRLTGYTMEEVHDIRAGDLITEDCRDNVKELEDLLLRGEAKGHLSEATLVKKDKSETSVQLSTSPISSNGQLVGFQHIARDVTEEKRMRENLRFYLQEVTKAQEEERKRIARELHDDTIQALVVLSRHLDALASGSKGLPKDKRLLLENLWQQTNKVMEGVRRLSQDLRPATLDRLGLVSAIEWLAEDVAKYSGIQIKVNVNGKIRRLPEEKELVLFRIAQEALRNVWRHSQASEAEVTIEFDKEKIITTISDNGQGFEVPNNMSDLLTGGKLGLAGMQERAQLLGTTLTIESKAGKGTSISVEVET